jgi:hypothetical protein
MQTEIYSTAYRPSFKFRTHLLYGLTRHVVLCLARLGSRAFVRTRLVKEALVIMCPTAVKLKQSLYSPGRALMAPGGWLGNVRFHPVAGHTGPEGRGGIGIGIGLS